METSLGSSPQITVFMAVYNGEKYLAFAIRSILNQDFKDFELLIVNDGSTDGSLRVIEQFDDNRIRVINNERNLGLFKTRNVGLQNAKGKYFAILDCDDIAALNRLRLQFEFLESNTEYVLCGGKGVLIDGENRFLGWLSVPVGDFEFIRACALFSNPFINSSTMIRTDKLVEFSYRDKFAPAEDYDVFERMINSNKTVNINKNLVFYRYHALNTSGVLKNDLLFAEEKIIKRQLNGNLKLELSEKDIEIHLGMMNHNFSRYRHSIADSLRYLDKLWRANKSVCWYDKDELDKVLFIQVLKLLLYRRSFAGVRKVLSSQLFWRGFSVRLISEALGAPVLRKIKKGKLINA